MSDFYQEMPDRVDPVTGEDEPDACEYDGPPDRDPDADYLGTIKALTRAEIEEAF